MFQSINYLPFSTQKQKAFILPEIHFLPKPVLTKRSTRIPTVGTVGTENCSRAYIFRCFFFLVFYCKMLIFFR